MHIKKIRRKTEDGRQEYEDGRRKSEDGSPKTEDRSPKTEVRRWLLVVGCWLGEKEVVKIKGKKTKDEKALPKRFFCFFLLRSLHTLREKWQKTEGDRAKGRRRK